MELWRNLLFICPCIPFSNLAFKQEENNIKQKKKGFSKKWNEKNIGMNDQYGINVITDYF